MSLNNFALTTLSENPEYFEEVIHLIESEFHYSEANHYEKDFAPLVNPLNFENCFLYIDQNTNTVAAHLAVSIRTLTKNKAETKTALIGGIVTDKKYRNKNLFKNLMEHALTLYGQQVSFFILWSDLESFYEKFFFYRTGGIIETGKKDLNSSNRPAGYEKTLFPLLSDDDFKQVINLYHNFNENYFFTVKRDEKDWSIIKEMTSIDLFIKKNAAGEIIKYFCANKGRDLTNIIHEVSCANQNEYLTMLKDLASYKIWLPETEADKVKSREIFYTAFIKLGNLELLNHFLDSITEYKLRIIDIHDDKVTFVFDNQTYNVSAKDFLQYLLGPKPLDEFKHYRLSLYITGTDSI